MKARKLVCSNRRELTGYGGTKLRAAGKQQTDQRICIAAAIYERNRPDPGIKNRQAPCGACRVMVRAAGLEPARRMAMEPKGYVTLVKDFQSPPYRKGRTSFQRFKRYSVVTGRTSAKS